MSAPQIKLCGWGYPGEGLNAQEQQALIQRCLDRYGLNEIERLRAPSAEAISLPPPRIAIPAALAGFCNTQTFARLTHTYGKSYPDYVRIFATDFSNAPDIVAFPTSEDQIDAVLDWASGANVAVIPFGGGTSVVGGVEPAVGGGFDGTLSLDLSGLDRILEIDRSSRAVRVQGGVRVPALETRLKPQGLTLRHFPQSFQLATIGGMIATRSGGHFATLYTHIDDFVESLRLLSPAGVVESRRLPGSGAGPGPDRLLMGSEGALGIITEAWMRLQNRPVHRASVPVLYRDFYRASEAVRALSQAGLYPSNLRLLDAAEARNNGFGDGKHAVLIVAFESADHPVGAWMMRALAVCRDFDGRYDEQALADPTAHTQGLAGAWREAFIRMPHLREILVSIGVINDTFETAITWDRFAEFHTRITRATEQAIQEATGRPGFVTCRFTHVYPDGPAPYFTFQALGRHGALLEQWRHIKEKAADAVIKQGGTITHHHAVGRDHMPWYKRQRPALFGAVLQAAKETLDPAGILNPGVIVPIAGAG